MKNPSRYPHGTPCWVELMTTDVSSTERFYGELLHWHFEKRPAGDHGEYVMCQLDGKDVAAMFQMPEELRARDIPSHWGMYIAVDNVDETAQAVDTVQGEVIQQPFDVPGAGRMAVVQDPTGANFSLWQAGDHMGAARVNTPNSWCWSQLASQDPKRVEAFYGRLFNWRPRYDDSAEQPYTYFMLGDRMVAGMLGTEAEWGDVPSHWQTYFAVENCDRAREQAEALGAKTMLPPQDIPDVGRFCVLSDPQGAAFMLATFKEMDAPPFEDD